MKSLNRFVLKAFLRPFVITFPVLTFIFLTQHMLKYSDYLAGRGIGFSILMELEYYFAFFIVPKVLPLSVLLSALIAFGNLGQHNELTAIKSSGISLLKIIRPVFFFVVLLAVGLFFYNDRIYPKANLKAWSLLFDVSKKKFFDLKPGVFYNDIDKFRIKVDQKFKDSGCVKGVTIYDHTEDFAKNNHYVVADSGRMYLINNDKYLVIELYNGNEYRQNVKGVVKSSNPQVSSFFSSSFKESKIVIPLSRFGLEHTDEKQFLHNKRMMNFNKLFEVHDSLKVFYDKLRLKTSSHAKVFWNYHFKSPNENIKSFKGVKERVDKVRGQGFNVLQQKVSNSLGGLKGHIEVNLNRKKRDYYGVYVEFWSRLNTSISCVLLFLIGAPIGAIVKKGGLGLPGLITVGFFILYYVLSMMFEKTAKEASVTVEEGMMYTNVIFLGIGVFFLWVAHIDASLTDNVIVNFARRLFTIEKQFKVIGNNGISDNIKDEILRLDTLERTLMSGGVPNSYINSKKYVEHLESLKQNIKQNYNDPDTLEMVERVPVLTHSFTVKGFWWKTILTLGVVYLVNLINRKSFLKKIEVVNQRFKTVLKTI